jgi:hypothetical protein
VHDYLCAFTSVMQQFISLRTCPLLLGYAALSHIGVVLYGAWLSRLQTILTKAVLLLLGGDASTQKAANTLVATALSVVLGVTPPSTFGVSLTSSITQMTNQYATSSYHHRPPFLCSAPSSAAVHSCAWFATAQILHSYPWIYG